MASFVNATASGILRSHRYGLYLPKNSHKMSLLPPSLSFSVCRVLIRRQLHLSSTAVRRNAEGGIHDEARHADEPFEPPNPTQSFPDSYVASNVERGWYRHWKRKGYFRPDPDADETFSMILPPPNVTGALHLGHALTVTVQDVLARWQRMRGASTLWVPGSDHAGIATQSVVERSLRARRGLTKEDVGRDAFLSEVWRWRGEKGDRIFEQLERLGASLDWERATFTMSDSHTRAVNEAFIRLFDRGRIYRGEFLVNWSCALGSAISDIEVDHLELSGKERISLPGYEKPVEFGQIFDISYRVKDSGEKLTVSTTRPETMLGDVALAVHPEDSRYGRLLSSKSQAIHPLIPGRLLPIIPDESVDPEFGTGIVKITPAHDKKDFEVGKRHCLPMLSVISESGHMSCPECQALHGLPRFEARWRVLAALREQDLFAGKRAHPMSVPICSRSGDVIEPFMKPQWFLNTSQMAKRALEAAESGELKFTPPSNANVWKNWLENDRDWCISRQLWWGHRIPVYHVLNNDSSEHWVAACSSEEALAKTKEKSGMSAVSVRQDEDVLDTWFSSAILPFANHGWPEQTADLQRFYPLSLLETGHDILFFWVARMVMLGLELTDRLPFSDVLLHGIVRDAHGRKMSKSLGNVVDPIHVIEGRTLKEMQDVVRESNEAGHISKRELPKALDGLRKDFPSGIPECGADALRYGLCMYDVSSAQINLDLTIVKTACAFGNKVWQASRFLVMAHQRTKSLPSLSLEAADIAELLPQDRWILSRCAVTVSEMEQHLSERNFPSMPRCLRRFLYTNLCDVYLEAAKPHLADPDSEHFATTLATLQLVLMTGLKLMHPLMPFLTEELYHRIPPLVGEHRKDSIMVEKYPLGSEWHFRIDEGLMRTMDEALEIVTAIRGLKGAFDVKQSVPSSIVVNLNDDGELERDIGPLTDFIRTLSNSRCVKIHSGSGAGLDGDFWASSKVGRHELHLDIEGIVNPEKALSKCALNRRRLEKDKRKIEERMTRDEKYEASGDKKDKNVNALGIVEDNLAQLSVFEELLHCYEKHDQQ